MDVPIGGNVSTHMDVACGTSPRTCYPPFAGTGVGIVSCEGKEEGKWDSSLLWCYLGIPAQVWWLCWEDGMEKGDKEASMSL